MSDDPAARLELSVRGRVQGVWYREHTRREAERLGLVGTVRNMPDGTVHAVVEGPHSLCAVLESWCWTGSPASSVTAVDSRWGQASGEFTSFRVTWC